MNYKSTEDTILPSIKEEIANSITHGIGAILSVIGLIFLLNKSINQGRILHVVSCSFYGGALVLLYVISTLYHAITHPVAKKVFRRLDHVCIYLLIFGTYMPLSLIALNGNFGWTLFGLECGCCVFGITFKAIFGPKFTVISTLFYLLMGWLAVFAIKPMYIAISAKGLLWVFLGGIFYTLGIIFFATDRKVSYFHAIWHLFVLVGSICHFFTVLWYVIPLSF
jgi:hemolysin III